MVSPSSFSRSCCDLHGGCVVRTEPPGCEHVTFYHVSNGIRQEMKTDGFHRLLALLLKRATESPRSIRLISPRVLRQPLQNPAVDPNPFGRDTHARVHKMNHTKIYTNQINCVHAFSILSSYHFYSESPRYLFYSIFRPARLCILWFISYIIANIWALYLYKFFSVSEKRDIRVIRRFECFFFPCVSSYFRIWDLIFLVRTLLYKQPYYHLLIISIFHCSSLWKLYTL